jgi:hypothetical protein
LQNPGCLLSGRKVRDSEERRRRKKKIMPSTMATTFLNAAHALRSDQTYTVPSWNNLNIVAVKKKNMSAYTMDEGQNKNKITNNNNSPSV